ncbi:MAG TPA: PIN domain-containing protein [Pyrinomonadaceae bacterium]|nr:PIN domain-containing protein [Pyrinomonadaceae bacterium]
MITFFVDASYWVALELKDDQNHKSAQSHWTSLKPSDTKLVTTTYVLDEAVTFLNSRNAHRNAVSLGNSILLSPSIELRHVDENLFFEGWKRFGRYDDKRFSLTDCISFIVMEDLGIHTALSFDSDFVQVGFAKLPNE